MCYLKLADKILSSVADLHGKISDVPPRGPNSFNFMQFLGKFGKIVCWHPLEGWRPTSGKSWIRHWSWLKLFAKKKIFFLKYVTRNCRYGSSVPMFAGFVVMLISTLCK